MEAHCTAHAQGGIIASFDHHARFVVVGAPGEDAVYILQLDPSWSPASGGSGPSEADPFGTGMVITRIDGTTLPTPVSSGDRFGQAVNLADLDDDGDLDLVVGAPSVSSLVDPTTGALATDNGAAWIFPGTGSPGGATPWVDPSASFRVDPEVFIEAQNGLVGSSLATGRLRGSSGPRVLAAGGPGMDNTQGGVCMFWWPPLTAAARVRHPSRAPQRHSPAYNSTDRESRLNADVDRPA